MPFLEICAFSLRTALLAAQSGAHRIELCTSPSTGGFTPPLNDLLTLKAGFPSIPVNVMIRSPAPDLVYQYSSEEMDIMGAQIEEFLKTGEVDGFVFGFVKDGKVDVERCKRLLEAAKGKWCTFHKAFDLIATEDMERELEVLKELGFHAVLTSGGKGTAVEGKEMLKRLVVLSGGLIDVIVGGGVRKENITELLEGTRARWIHSAALGEGGFDEQEVEAMMDVVEGFGRGLTWKRPSR
ncbi:CutC-like protein [Glarea lozoyensis ATCC 20868]|uniref:Copper homeostasis protein cutC homolog n=1 Tax=Glarea lozoyensis (strain ATCC 20868 / MF5171) TaxID=1116229 RepID=S3DN24_GLAL2|nr:CutC-like protein [Glarea lozoyensis ATCC 20868]EPE27883.1 CutC-like protein [Glarea lozoyensis ATCC 20868]